MKISIIIPTYNDKDNLEKCLIAILESSYKPYEVIVVDDASTDNSKEVVDNFGYRYIRLENNRGQATARNAGAKIAQGDILFFIDSDVRIRNDTIAKVAKAYEDPKIKVYQGIASKTPLNKGFGPELMALRWYYLLHKIRKASFVHSLVFSIRKSVFDEVGGFNEKFKHPGAGEEFEMGHRLRKKYILHTNPELLVEHRFQKILPRTRTLYKRAKVWASLFSKTKRFEKANANLKEALIGVFDILTLLSLLLIPFYKFFFLPLIFFLIVQTMLNSGFYFFLLKEKGIFFMLKSIIPNMLWSIVQILGAIDFYIKKSVGVIK